MKYLKDIFIGVLAGVVTLLSLYLNKFNTEKIALEQELKSKDKVIFQLETANKQTITFVKFSEAEQEMIELVKTSDEYKSAEKGLEPYAYLKFTNNGFQANDRWIMGKIDYVNVHKATNNREMIEGLPLSYVSSERPYIMKFNQHGNIETIAIRNITQESLWNEMLSELPINIMTQALKDFWKHPEE